MTALPIWRSATPAARDMQPLNIQPMSKEDRRFWQLRESRGSRPVEPRRSWWAKILAMLGRGM